MSETEVTDKYDVKTIYLNATMTNKEFAFDATVIVVGQIPIEVRCRVNDMGNEPFNLQIFRQLNMNVQKLYLTTTDISSTPLILFVSKGVTVATSGFGNRAVLVDSLASEYDARKVKTTLADSTIVNLADGATYTGAQFATEGYQKIIGSVFSNAAGTLYVDQSQDITNYDVIETIAYAAGSVLVGFSVEIVAPYARIRFIDTAGTAQTSFRLFAYLSTGV